MPVPLDRAHLDEYLARVDRLAESAHPRFGSLTPHRVLVHLVLPLEVAVGDRPPTDAGNVFTKSLIGRWLLVDVLPWPKGRIKVPDEFTPPPDGTFEEARNRLREAMKRFVAEAERNPGRIVMSAGFGPMRLNQWMRLQGKHLNHHLEQFGV